MGNDSGKAAALSPKNILMRTTFLLLSVIAAGLLANAQETITLDLAHSTTKLQFDADNGAWTETFNDDITSI